ncbi:hypothetical protein BH11ARM2_BH11ARM2_18830 [soil metagenome]
MREFRNLHRYDGEQTPFVEGFSHLSAGFAPDGPFGIGPVHPRSVLSTYALADPTLSLAFRDERMRATRRQDLQSWPWSACEEATIRSSGSNIGVESTLCFVDERTLAYEVRFFTTDAEALIAPLFHGRGLSDEKRFMVDLFHGSPKGARHLSVVRVGEAVEIRLSPQAGLSSLPCVALRIRCDHPDWRMQTLAQAPWSGSDGDGGGPFYLFEPPSPITLQGGRFYSVRFQIEVRAAASGEYLPNFRDEIDGTPMETLEERACARFLTAIGGGRPEEGVEALRARTALVRTGLRGLNGVFGDSVASLCTSDRSDFSCSFFWDTLFSAVAIARFNGEFARGAIETAFVRQRSEDGAAPERKFNFSVPERMVQASPQAPIASWAALEYDRQADDPEFLRRIYPSLLDNHRFWRDHSDVDRDGLSEFRWSGQAADNSPLWDAYGGSGKPPFGCTWLPPVASVALNAFLYQDATHLALIARRLGLDNDAAAHEDRARQLQADLFATCYRPDEHRFWDFNRATGQHERQRTFYMFWPLVCGMDVPEDTARDLIENVLLDEWQFFGDVPFPSVPYDDPRHQSDGYWRGRAWPHVSYWLIEMLWRYGYRAQADEAADRLLYLWSASPGFMENHPSDAKRSLRPGFADYNWGAAAMLLLLDRAYREGACADLSTSTADRSHVASDPRSLVMQTS